MATLGALRTRIADELQIDATTHATEIDRAIFTAIEHYNDEDFWFLDASPATFTLSATTQYALATVLPGRSQIKTITLHINQSKPEMQYRTLDEILTLDYDPAYTGEPQYWTIDHDTLMIQPKPQQTYTAEVYYSLRRSISVSASASGVWTTEAEELIRIHAEIDILENRIKDYDEATRKRPRLVMALRKLSDKTVVQRGQRRIKPFM